MYELSISVDTLMQNNNRSSQEKIQGCISHNAILRKPSKIHSVGEYNSVFSSELNENSWSHTKASLVQNLMDMCVQLPLKLVLCECVYVHMFCMCYMCTCMYSLCNCSKKSVICPHWLTTADILEHLIWHFPSKVRVVSYFFTAVTHVKYDV